MTVLSFVSEVTINVFRYDYTANEKNLVNPSFLMQESFDFDIFPKLRSFNDKENLN